MPSIRLKFPQPWYDSIRRAAEQSNQTPEQLLRGLVALSIAPPPSSSSGSRLGHLPQEQALIDRVGELCRTLEATRNQLAGALQDLAQKPRHYTRVLAERAVSSSCLRAAMKRKGVSQSRLAARIGVAQSSISLVLNQRMTLPPAWVTDLNDFFGENWLDERIGG